MHGETADERAREARQTLRAGFRHRVEVLRALPVDSRRRETRAPLLARTRVRA
ncbi:hypothetical protein [Paraburkholderia sp. Ac-20347]|uniref:hypothetical protein n=1 Tax=Paraburkholderia sp. Ac-20347 TaxID=2703892 RepID=UPI00197F6828|nr:hypothetical protein [Paraburkholderia sp. Ac-20347]MBN3814668.1 hypothetical protein [Paraburkholderia sp. Ac-20347]